MQAQHLIPADEFCTHNKIEFSFISSLHEFGLIELTTVEQNYFIDIENIQELEKFMRLHYDLEINLEGIETVNYLLQKVKGLHDEITLLKNKLSLYEQI